jgi:GNS1/SUR4 family
MLLILKNFFKFLSEHKGKIRTLNEAFFYKISSFFTDPRVDNLPLIFSVFPVLLIIILYVFFVTNWGPKLMRDRKPFQLNSFIAIYNLFQIVANLIILYTVRHIKFVLTVYLYKGLLPMYFFTSYPLTSFITFHLQTGLEEHAK